MGLFKVGYNYIRETCKYWVWHHLQYLVLCIIQRYAMLFIDNERFNQVKVLVSYVVQRTNWTFVGKKNGIYIK